MPDSQTAQFLGHLTQFLQQKILQGDRCRIVSCGLIGESLQGTFVTPEQKLFRFVMDDSGVSYQWDNSRSDAFVSGMILAKAPRTRLPKQLVASLIRQDNRQCTGRTSQPCGRTCINENDRCHVRDADVKRIAKGFVAQAKPLNLGAALGERQIDELAIQKALKQVNSSIRQNIDHEELVAVDARGQVVSRTKGTQYNVEIPFSDLEKIKGSTVTHNHPTWNYPPGDPRLEGRSLSLPDLRAASLLSLREMQAVSPGYLYSMKPGKNGWGNYTFQIQPAYTRHAIEVHQELSSKIRKGEISANRAEQDFQGLINERVAKDLGWTYKVQKIPLSPADKIKARKAVKNMGIPNLIGHQGTADAAVSETMGTVLGGLSWMAGAALIYQTAAEIKAEEEERLAQRRSNAK